MLLEKWCRRLAGLRAATSLQLVKQTIFAKHNKKGMPVFTEISTIQEERKTFTRSCKEHISGEKDREF